MKREKLKELKLTEFEMHVLYNTLYDHSLDAAKIESARTKEYCELLEQLLDKLEAVL